MWGRHLIVNARACNKTLISSYSNIHRFNEELIQKIHMKAYGLPQIIHFGTGNKAGYTLLQMIETSNIAAHFCDETGDSYIDVFSCKDFCQYTAKDIIQKYFEPKNIYMKMLHRDANHRMD